MKHNERLVTPLALHHGQRWEAFRRIQDCAVSNPHYCWDDPRKWGYLKVAQFCMHMMAIHNDLAWKYQREGK